MEGAPKYAALRFFLVRNVIAQSHRTIRFQFVVRENQEQFLDPASLRRRNAMEHFPLHFYSTSAFELPANLARQVKRYSDRYRWHFFNAEGPVDAPTGRYDFWIEGSTTEGLPLRSVRQRVTVELVAPQLQAVLPPGDEPMAIAPDSLSFQLDRTVLPEAYLETPVVLSDIGEVKFQALVRKGILTLADLLERDYEQFQVVGWHPVDGKDLMARIGLLKDLNIALYKAQDWWFEPINALLEHTFETWTERLGKKPAAVKRFIRELQKLQLIFDRSVRDRLSLQHFKRFPHSGIANVEAHLGVLNVSDQVTIKKNEFTVAIPTDLPEGLHRLSIQVIFHSGVFAVAESSFFLDNQPPEISECIPSDGAIVAVDEILLSVRLVDRFSHIREAGCQLLFNGEIVAHTVRTSTNGQSLWMEYATGLLQEGTHTWQVVSEDELGNRHVSEEKTFTIDFTPPAIALDVPIHTMVDRATFLLKGKVDEPNLESVWVGETSVNFRSNGHFEVEVPLEFGENYLQAFAKDKAGNESQSTLLMVARLDPQTAAIQGQVKSSEGQNLAGVSVRLSGLAHLATTDAEGRFTLMEVPEGRHQLKIEPTGQLHEIAFLEVEASYGRITRLPDPIVLLPDFAHQAVAVTIDSGQSRAVNPLYPELEISWETTTELEFPEGTSQLSLGLVAADQFPVPLQGITLGGRVAVLGPPGLKVKEGKKIGVKLPNDCALPAGTAVPILLLDRDNNRFRLGCMAQVSEDGTAIATAPGDGVSHFSVAAPRIPAPFIEVLQEDGHVPGGDALKGGLELEVALPSFRLFGEERTPMLRYSSRAACPEVQLTGVFRGLEEYHVEEKLAPYTLDQVTTLERVRVHKNIQRYRLPGFWEQVRGKNSPRDDGQSGLEETVFLPLGRNPYALLPKGKITEGETDSPKKWEEYSYQVLQSEPVEVLRLSALINTNLEHTLWPTAITSKHYLGYLETEWEKLYGKPVERTILNIETGVTEQLATYELPKDLTVVQHLKPRFASGEYYPTGLYPFLARYRFEMEGFSSESKHSVKSLFIDQDFLNSLYRQRSDLASQPGSTQRDTALVALNEQIADMEQMRIAYQQDQQETSNRHLWIEPADQLFKHKHGALILHNLQHSTLGRGWSVDGVQELVPVGRSKVLVIDGSEKLVFSAEEMTVREIWKKKEGDPLVQDALLLPEVSRSNYNALVLGQARIAASDGLSNYVAPLDDGLEVASQKFYEPSQRFSTLYEAYWFYYPVFNAPPRRSAQRRSLNSEVVLLNDRPNIEVTALTVDREGTLFLANAGTHQILRLGAAENPPTVIAGRFSMGTYRGEDDEYGSFDMNQVPPNGTGTYTEVLETRYLYKPWFTPDGYWPYWSSIHSPAGITFDLNNNLIFSERGRHLIRRIVVNEENPNYGTWETLAGRNIASGEQFDPDERDALQAVLPSPGPLASDEKGNLYCLLDLSVTGFESHVVVKIDPQGVLTHIAGNPHGTITTGIDATMHKIVGASDLVLDRDGKLFIHVVGKVIVVSPDGFVDDFVGGGNERATTESKNALSVELESDGKLNLDEAGNLHLFYPESGRILKVSQNLLDAESEGRLRGPVGYWDSVVEKQVNDTWVRTYKSGRQVVFDHRGKAVTESDSNGNTTHFDRDAFGNLTRIRYPNNSAYLDFQYDENGYLNWVEDHAGRRTHLSVAATFWRFPPPLIEQLKGLGLPDAYADELADRSFTSEAEVEEWLTQLPSEFALIQYKDLIVTGLKKVYDLQHIELPDERTLDFSYAPDGKLISQTESE